MAEQRRTMTMALGMALLASTAQAADTTARAGFVDLKGAPIGSARLLQRPDGVLIRVELSGLAPGAHGFHIHAAGKCDPPFASAGGHFNPAGHRHGFAAPGGYHAGDLPNIVAGPDGKAAAEVLAAGVSLDQLLGAAGTALVVHAGADDYITDPSGNSGDRIACGVITR